jgi:hypothetical protein
MRSSASRTGWRLAAGGWRLAAGGSLAASAAVTGGALDVEPGCTAIRVGAAAAFPVEEGAPHGGSVRPVAFAGPHLDLRRGFRSLEIDNDVLGDRLDAIHRLRGHLDAPLDALDRGPAAVRAAVERYRERRVLPLHPARCNAPFRVGLEDAEHEEDERLGGRRLRAVEAAAHLGRDLLQPLLDRSVVLGRELEAQLHREPRQPIAVASRALPPLLFGVLQLGEDGADAAALQELEPLPLRLSVGHACQRREERPGEIAALEGGGEPRQVDERLRDAQGQPSAASFARGALGRAAPALVAAHSKTCERWKRKVASAYATMSGKPSWE